MKTVFTNRQAIHVWAQQTQDAGHSANVSFRGPTLYSYSTPIAHFIRPNVCLITTERYSNTTSGKHMPRYNDIPPGVTAFRVPWIGVDGGRAPDGSHESNLDYLVQEY